MAFTVYAQADVVTARLTLEPRSAAGSLETTIMEAIAAGANTQRSLCDILGLAPRLVLQVLGDLWRAGRITINLGSEHETLELTTSGNSALRGTDTVDGLARTTASASTTEDVIVERVTGRALPIRAAVFRVPHEERDLIVPTLPDDREPSDITSAELVAALAATLRLNGGDDDQRGDQRVTAAFLQPDLLRVASRRRYVELRAAAQLTDTGEITISVLDDKLTVAERALATSRLQQVIEEHPNSHFTNRVRTRASHIPLKPYGVEQAVDELNRAITSLASAAPKQRQQSHDRATTAINRIAAYAHTLTTREMDVQVVHTSEEHTAVIRDLFKTAEHQIVLAVPWIRQKGLEPFRTAICEALNRGIQVVLLWGINGHENGLGNGEADWLDSITAFVNNHGAPGKFLYSRKRAARSHAKLMIADDRRMLVTSKNFLSRSNHFETGVMLSAIGNRASPAIDLALRYVYDKAPEPRLAYGLHRLPGAFGPREQPDEIELKLPRLTKSLLEETASEASVQAWSTAWCDAAGRALHLLESAHPVVNTIADLQHRGVLRNAVSEPKSRVLLTSDKVTDTALTEDIVDQVAHRVEDGTSVCVRYREAAGTENRGLDQLLDLGQKTDLNLKRDTHMHAKIVLHDDTVLVGSFNPLSVDADLRHSRAAGEFGVVIRSAVVANSIWTLLGGPSDALSDVSTTATNPLELTDSDLAQELLEALESPAADPLTTKVATYGLSRLLTVFNDFDLDDGDLIRIGGAALATASSDDEQIAAADILLQPLIGAGNWGLARTLRALLPETVQPRPAFLDALHEGARTAMSLLTATTSDVPPVTEETEALTIVDCVALLLHADPYRDGDPVITMSMAQPSVRSAAFVDAACEHSRNYGHLPAISPHMLGQGNGDLPTLWAAAQAALTSFEHYDSQSTVGEMFLAAIFGDEGEMTRLATSLSSRNQQEVLDWHAAASKSTDSKWLDKATQRAGIGRIVDSRRRTFLNLRRRLREELTNLCAAIQLQLGQDVARPIPTHQLDLINQVVREAEALHRDAAAAGSTPEAVISAETQRLILWSGGNQAEGMVRDWHDWPFVSTYQAVSDHPHAGAAPLSEIGTDLARVPDPETAVRELARIGEFHRASVLIEQLGFDDVEVNDLQLYVARCRTEAQALFDEQLKSLSLACQRAGLQTDDSAMTIVVTGRQANAASRLAILTADLEASIKQRRSVVADLCEQSRDKMSTEWAEYVGALINDGELELADKALLQPDGIRHTPVPRPFLSWGWRDASLGRVARWLANGDAGPLGVDEFIPATDDEAGKSVVHALAALAEERPAASTQWVEAVQQLVHSDNDYPRARPEVVDGITTTTFQLPYDHQRLPRLRWVGKDPIRVAVGAEAAPDCSLRFSLDVSADDPADVAIDIADVLSLITRRNLSAIPSAADRALQFTAMVCSRLDMSEVIEPRDTPTGTTEHARHRLAWLLTILGLNAEGRDIDRLIVWSGGHAGVMWALVRAARQDPISGISSLANRPNLAKFIVEGVELDLDRDEDLLVLALGQTSLLLVEGCTEAELAALLEDEWRRAMRPIDHRIRVSEVLERLNNKGYVSISADGIIRSCMCRAALAIEEIACDDWFARQMDLLDPVTRMRNHQHEFVLEMIRHQEQAERTLDNDEMHRRTSDLLRTRLSEKAPFDLVRLSEDVLRNYRLTSVDIIPELHAEPLEISDLGPSLWIECLVSELLNNAVAATADLPEGEGTVWLTVAPDSEHDQFVVLEVRNNGRRMPPDVREAFLAGRRLRRPQSDNDVFGRKQDRGLGLYMFRTYGELHGVSYNIREDSSGMTVVTCRIPRGMTPANALRHESASG